MTFDIFRNKNIKFYLIQQSVQPYLVLSFILPAYLFLSTKDIVLVGVILSIAYLLGHLTIIAGFLTDYITNTKLYDFILSILSGLTFILSFLNYSESENFIFIIYVILGLIHTLKGTNHRKVLRSIVGNSYKDYRNIWITTHIIRTITSIILLYMSFFVIGLKYTLLVLGLFILLVHSPLIFLIEYPRGTGSARMIINISLSLLKNEKRAQFYIIDNFIGNFLSGMLPVFIGAFSLTSSFIDNYVIYYIAFILYDSIYLILTNKGLKINTNDTYYILLIFRGLVPSFILFTIIFLPTSLYIFLFIIYSAMLTFYNVFIVQIIQFSIPKEIFATFTGLNVTFGSLFYTLGNLILPYMELTLGLKSVIALVSIILAIYSLIISYGFKDIFKIANK